MDKGAKNSFLSSETFLFSALFAIIEGASALALSAGEAMFIAGVGVDGLPLAYIILFGVMLAATAAISYMQSKIPLERVLKILLWFFFWFVFALTASISIFGTSGALGNALLYALKLGASVWMYSVFTLYWNFADEHFNVREGKRLYSVFAGFGCAGATVGAGLVFASSEWLKLDASLLLWLWFGSIALCFPLVERIRKTCTKLDSGVDFESSGAGFFESMSGNFSAMRKSPYVRAMIFMYTALIAAAAINEFVALSAFQEHAENSVADLAEPEKSAAAQLALASLFGALGMGVNVFNFAANMFVYNRLVSRIGVKNIVPILSVLYIAAFVWLINSFGLAAAVFSFFIYRGFMESVDADNENIMVSILPGALRQQTRLAIEVFVVPFATALAGVFLMLYAKGGAGDFSIPFLEGFAEKFSLGSLSVIGVSIAGLLCALAGFAFSLVCRHLYPLVLETNIRAGWLDFSRSFAEICGARSDENNDFDAFACGNDGAKILAAAEVESLSNPKSAFSRIVDGAPFFDDAQKKRASSILSEIFAKKDFGLASFAVEWLLNANCPHPDFALEAASRSGVLAKTIASNFGAVRGADLRRIRSLLSLDDISDEISVFPDDTAALDVSGKIETLRRIRLSADPRYCEVAAAMLSDSSAEVQNAALCAFAKCMRGNEIWLGKKTASMFRFASADGAEAALEILSKIGSEDCLETLLSGLSSISAKQRRKMLGVVSGWGAACVPTVVGIIRSPDFSYAAKAVCAMSLNSMFPSQLKMLAPELVSEQFRAAYSFAARELALSSSDAAVAGLSKIYKWKRRSAVSFAIMLLSQSGCLPSYETVLAALFSRSEKERAGAFEIVENGLSRAEFAKFLPLVDGRPLGEVVDAGSRLCGVERVDCKTVLDEAQKSASDEEFLSLCAVLLAQNDFDAVSRAICAKIGVGVRPDMRADLIEILDEMAFAKFGDCAFKNSYYSCLHKFSALNLCGFFADFEPSAVSEIALRAVSAPAGESVAGEDCVAVFSKSFGVSDATFGTFYAGEKIAATEPFLIVKLSDIFAVANNYPDAAEAVFKMEAAK